MRGAVVHDPSVGMATRIRDRRKALGLTQVDLATATKISQPQISEYETSQSIPSGDRLVAIARALHVTSEWIVEGGPEPGEGDGDKPHWAEFLERYEHVGELTAQELHAIKNFAARSHKIGGWYDWAQLAEWYRNRKPDPEFLAAREANRRRREESG